MYIIHFKLFIMETRFVKAFLKPQTVVHSRSRKNLGICDGAAGFGDYFYAVLRSGSVTLYDYDGKVLYDNLDDVWVAPNGYRLIKKKDSVLWELFDPRGEKKADGDKIKVMNDNGYNLLFIKQYHSDVWFVYDLCQYSIGPTPRKYAAEDIEAFYLEGFRCCRLIFAVVENGTHKLWGINPRNLRPETSEWVENAPFFEILPDGYIAVSQQDISAELIKANTFVFWRPSSEQELPARLYSHRLRLHDTVRGLAVFPDGVKFCCGEDKVWYVVGADGRCLLPNRISHLCCDLRHECLTGYIETGAPCTFSVVSPHVSRFDIDGKVQSFIIDGYHLYDAGGCSNLCLI